MKHQDNPRASETTKSMHRYEVELTSRDCGFKIDQSVQVEARSPRHARDKAVALFRCAGLNIKVLDVALVDGSDGWDASFED